MAKIYTAIYRNNNKEEIIDLLSINSKNYYEKFRNKLFCSEPNCSAKISYVAMAGNARRNYLRKWKNSHHSENCLHYTDEVKSNPRKRSSGTTTVIVSEEQISKSLKEAFLLELMTEEEREKKRDEDRRKRDKRIRRIGDNQKTEQLSLIELTTNPEESATAFSAIKGGRLLKRNIDALKDKDIGRTRTVIGSFLELIHTQEKTIIRVGKNGSYLDMKFEEAFFAGAPEFRDMFPLIQRFAKETEQTIIIATGEVKRSEVENEFSISVFDKAGLSIHGKRLADLAREYSLGHFNF